MKKQGYVISQDNTKRAFFTSSSAYDRPQWISLTEATIYPTAELATNALTKLMKNGSYAATVVEAASMEFEFPDEGPNKDHPPITQTDEPTDNEMVAGELNPEEEMEDLDLDDEGFVLPDEEQQPDEEYQYGEEDPEGEPDFSDPRDADFGIDEPSDELEVEDQPRRVGEGLETSFKTITYNETNPESKDTNFADEVRTPCAKVKTPANVMAAIKRTIQTFDDAAEFNNGKDDAKASFSLTVSDALKTIEDCLKLGTEEGLKQAQIRITTFMSPIINNFPPEVTDYLYKSGRQPLTLKDTFYNKWDKREK